MGRRSKKIMQKNMIVLFCLILLFSPFGTAFTNMGGQVEAKGESIATEITDVDGLNDIRHNLAGNYVLVENIDLSQVDDWVAIGTVNEPFEGVFNWNGFKLVGIEKATVDDYENLFGVVADLASLVDIVVEDGNITENTDDETDNDIIKDIQIDENSEYSDVYAGDESEEGKIVPFFAPAGIQTTDEDEVEFAGGDGSKNNPFLIDDAHQLNKVREGLDKHYKLTANVNLDVDPYNEGSGWEPIGKATSGQQFLGSFDGNGYTYRD